MCTHCVCIHVSITWYCVFLWHRERRPLWWWQRRTLNLLPASNSFWYHLIVPVFLEHRTCMETLWWCSPTKPNHRHGNKYTSMNFDLLLFILLPQTDYIVHMSKFVHFISPTLVVGIHSHTILCLCSSYLLLCNIYTIIFSLCVWVILS